jgi:3-oxoacyl-[acyl-carrier protein] reductase
VLEYDFNQAALKGKNLLVAGGTGGLGRAVVALLARDGANLLVGFKDNRDRALELQKSLQTAHGVEIGIVGGDISTAEGRSQYLKAVREMEGALYGLVCLTGDPARVKFDQATDQDIQDSMAVNYAGPILLARAVAEEMKATETSGAIVLFSTMQAVALFDSSINYAGPKKALIHAARIMAKQWGGPDDIRVNVVAPGVNRAGMALSSIASGKYDFFVDEGIIPRFGKAEDVAKVVRLLVEPDNYLTGQVITVDGGLTLRKDLR